MGSHLDLGWHIHADVWLMVAVLEGGYLTLLKRVGPRRAPAGTSPATRGQKAAFSLGVALLWLASDWPIHDVAERSLYSVHMVQHMIISLAVPPLILLGTPAWLARMILQPPAVMRLVRAITRPLPALLLFNTVLVLMHWPVVVSAAVHHHALHFVVHAVLFASAMVMWMPVCSPLLELPRLPLPAQMLYLFGQSLVPTVPASFLTFSSHPLYRVYEALPRPWGMAAVTDQQIAGLTMKIAGGLFLWVIMAAVFFKWYAREQEDGVDALKWQDVERSLARVDLARSDRVANP
jgi:putative membrane protein